MQICAGRAHYVKYDASLQVCVKRGRNVYISSMCPILTTSLNFVCSMQITEADLLKVFSLNTNSVALGFKYQLAAIEKSGGNGSIVVNTSVAASYVSTLPLFAGNGIYAASKSAADTITKYAVSTCCLHH
jgi:NAD(P)-dependent dehydrogenase (short-subunit alcohol dehydrogenase family)